MNSIRKVYKASLRLVPQKILVRSVCTRLPLSDSPNAQREFLNDIGQALNVKHLKDWYNVSAKTLKEFGATELLKRHNNRIDLLLSSVYPEHKFIPWLFPSVPQYFWHEPAHRRWFFDWLAPQLGITKPHDWYHVTWNSVKKLGVPYLTVRDHFFNMSDAISDAYPEHQWYPWRFAMVPKGYWDTKENQRKFFDYAMKELRLKTMEDWEQVTEIELILLGGGSMLMHKHNNSVKNAIQYVYSEHEWYPRRPRDPTFSKTERKAEERAWLEWAAKKLGLLTLDDWYRVTVQEFKDLGGRPLLTRMNSMCAVLRDKYPDHEWCEWKFKQVPIFFWDYKPNRIRYMEWLVKQLNIKSPRDWFEVTVHDFEKNHGITLIQNHYGSSVMLAVSEYLGEEEALPWLSPKIPSRFWENQANRKRFMDWVAKYFDINSPAGWHEITADAIQKLGGSQLLQMYHHRVDVLLRDVYRETDAAVVWESWRFPKAKRGFWEAKSIAALTACTLPGSHSDSYTNRSVPDGDKTVGMVRSTFKTKQKRRDAIHGEVMAVKDYGGNLIDVYIGRCA